MDNFAHEDFFDFRPIGIAIKKARKKHGWSREELSEKSGVSIAYLVDIENKGQSPSTRKLFPIIKSLELSLDDFIYANDLERQPKKSFDRRQVERHLDLMSEKEIRILRTGLEISNPMEL